MIGLINVEMQTKLRTRPHQPIRSLLFYQRAKNITQNDTIFLRFNQYLSPKNNSMPDPLYPLSPI
jgi:hypothetical protein